MKSISTFLIFALVAAQGQSQQSAPWQSSQVLKKAFLASYGVDPGVEPTLSEDDRLVLNTIQPVIEKSRVEAITALAKYVDARTNARFDLILGNLFLEQGRPAEASKCFERALVKFPKFRAVYKNLAMMAVQSGQYDKAVLYLGKTIELGDGDPEVFGLLGRAHLAKGDGSSAETAFRQAMLLQPERPEWKKGNLAALVRQKKIAEALAELDVMLAKDPGATDLLRQQAQLLVANEESLKSAEILEIIALKGEAKPDDYFQMGDIYVVNKMPGAAVLAYSRAMEAGSDPDRILKAIEVLAVNGAHDEAGNILEKLKSKSAATDAADLKKRILKVSARLAAARKADGEAAAILKEITIMDPLDADAWMLLGKYYQEQSETERAISAYEMAAGIPEFRADANVRLSQIYVTKRDFPKAIQLLEDAQRIKNRDSVARYLDQLRILAKSRSN